MNNPNDTLLLADRCVKCGLCLPQCPTYALSLNENESPRGRIALIQGYLSGHLSASATLTDHLSRCLLCRRCERVCPSAVPYAQILTDARLQLQSATAGLKSSSPYSLLRLITQSKLENSFFQLLRLFQKLKVFSLLKISGLSRLFRLQRLLNYLPVLKPALKLQTRYPAGNKSQGCVALFTGCLSRHIDQEVVLSAIRVLNRLGYDVDVPGQQTCCGALNTHQDQSLQKNNHLTQNLSAFNKNYDAIVSLVNGCTSHLKEYPVNSKQKETAVFSDNVKDIIEFIADADWSGIRLSALNKTASIQFPCSLQNVLRIENKLSALVHKIPGLHILEDSNYSQCCGAGGSYFLSQPDIADQLRDKSLDSLLKQNPDYIISSNLGCNLHLQAGMENNIRTKVIHPVVLLAQQLD